MALSFYQSGFTFRFGLTHVSIDLQYKCTVHMEQDAIGWKCLKIPSVHRKQKKKKEMSFFLLDAHSEIGLDDEICIKKC